MVEIIKIVGMFLIGLLILSAYGINLIYLFIAILIETIPNMLVPVILRFKCKKTYDSKKIMNITFINFVVVRVLFGVLAFTILTLKNYEYYTATLYAFVLLIVNEYILSNGKSQKRDHKEISKEIKDLEHENEGWGKPKSEFGQTLMAIAVLGIFLWLIISIIISIFN